MTISAELRVRVTDLFLDYAQCIDDDRVEAWPEYFTDDAVYKITTRNTEARGLPMAIMSCRGIGQIRDRITALRKANIFEPHHHNHLLGPSRLTRQGDGAVHARTSVVVYRTMEHGEQERFAVGRYEDVLVEQGGDIKIQQRKVVLDSHRVDVLIVYPL